MGLVASSCSLLAYVVRPAYALVGWMVSSWQGGIAGQDGGRAVQMLRSRLQVIRGMPWATEGFALPVHPGLVPCQVLLQMWSYSWLRTGRITEGRSGREHCGTGGKPCLCHSFLAHTFQTVLFPYNICGERGTNGPALVLDVPEQGLGRRQECLTQQSQQAALPQQLQQRWRGCLTEKCSH